PDEIYVHKPTLRRNFAPILWEKVGPKETKLIYDADSHRLRNVQVPTEEREVLCLSRPDILTLARWALAIEDLYEKPMDIEWAQDGFTGELFVVQARPETVHAQKSAPTLEQYHLTGAGEVLVEGLAVGHRIGTGVAHVIPDA